MRLVVLFLSLLPVAAAVAEPAAAAPDGDALFAAPSSHDVPAAGAATAEAPEGHSLELGAFGDVGGVVDVVPQLAPSFALGNFSLYFTSQASRGFSFLGEVALEANPENGVELDLERLQATWRLDQRLAVSVGRLQQSLGYYNTAYHAAAYLMTAADRPLVVAFADQGGVLPVHMVGLEVAGELEPGPLQLGYALDVANGRGASVEDVLHTFDTNVGKSLNLLAWVGYEPWGLRVGGNALVDSIPEVTAPGAERPALREQIFGAHALVEHGAVTVLGEWYLVRSFAPTIPTASLQGAFVEAAVQVGAFRPFVRAEWLGAFGAKSLFLETLDPGEQLLRGLAGVRIDLARRTALKLQLDGRQRSGADFTLSGRLQLAFAF